MSTFGQDDEVTAPATKPKAAFGASDTQFGANDAPGEAATSAAPAPWDQGPDKRNWFEQALGFPKDIQKWGELNPAPTMRETLGLPDVSQSGRKDRDEPTAYNFAGVPLAPDAPQAAKAIADSATFGLSAKGLGYLNPEPAAPGEAPSYAGGVAKQRADLEKWQKENPGRALSAGFLGAALPGTAVAKGAKAGLEALRYTPSLIGKMLMAGTGAEAFNAASRAGHTEGTPADYGEALKKGLGEPMTVPTPWGDVSSKVPTPWGDVTIPAGAVAAGIPLAGKALGAGASFLSPYFQKAAPGMGRAATGVAQDALPFNTPERLAELGPPATFSDVGPAALSTTRGVLQRSMGTPLQSDIENAFAERAKGAPTRLQEGTHANIGQPLDPKAMAEEIRKYGKTQTDPMYEDLWSGSTPPPPVNVRTIVKQIEAEIPSASADVKTQLKFLHGELTEPIQGGGRFPKSDAKTLHNIKVGIGNKADFDPRVPPGTVANGALKHYYGLLSDALDKHVPGYGAVTAEAKKYFDWVDALNKGFTTLGNKDAWPATFKKSFDAMSPAEQHLVQQGMASKAGQVVGGGGSPADYPQMRKLLGGDLDFNRENLTHVIGPEKTADMVRRVDAEQTFADTNANLSSKIGSKTAGSLASGGGLAKAEMPALGQVSISASPTGLLLRGAQNLGNMAYDTLRGMQRAKMVEQLGRAFSTPPSPELIRALMAGKGHSERAREGAYNFATNPGLASGLLGYGNTRE